MNINHYLLSALSLTLLLSAIESQAIKPKGKVGGPETTIYKPAEKPKFTTDMGMRKPLGEITVPMDEETLQIQKIKELKPQILEKLKTMKTKIFPFMEKAIPFIAENKLTEIGKELKEIDKKALAAEIADLLEFQKENIETIQAIMGIVIRELSRVMFPEQRKPMITPAAPEKAPAAIVEETAAVMIEE